MLTNKAGCHFISTCFVRQNFTNELLDIQLGIACLGNVEQICLRKEEGGFYFKELSLKNKSHQDLIDYGGSILYCYILKTSDVF